LAESSFPENSNSFNHLTVVVRPEKNVDQFVNTV